MLNLAHFMHKSILNGLPAMQVIQPISYWKLDIIPLLAPNTYLQNNKIFCLAVKSMCALAI